MVFSSSLFLFYFLPVFLLIYYLTPSRFRNLVALLASVFFYSWGGSEFIFVLIISILVDFNLVKHIARSEGSRKKRLVTISILLNVGLLAFFKYFNFFIDNLTSLLSVFDVTVPAVVSVALPIGISFFTFQKMSYSIDVYRGVRAPLQKLTDYALYIMLFPQLIAGPIVRFSEIADQILDRSASETAKNRVHGFYRFVIGLSKKVLIANVMGEYADLVFSLDSAELTTSMAWLGSIAYAFQIYFDFSGYSDMAIGLGKMMGFDFPENFDNPYISKSITEFWRRWHMTLSRWMRDYLYIPLGGSRVSTTRMYLNLWIVFLVSGLWHGASWNFILWGAFHGTFLILDRLFLISWTERLGKVGAISITFIITLFGWVLFRAPDLSTTELFYSRMLSLGGLGLHSSIDMEFWVMLVIAGLFSFASLSKWGAGLGERFFKGQYSMRTASLMLLPMLCLFYFSWAAITTSDFNPFIYFRF